MHLVLFSAIYHKDILLCDLVLIDASSHTASHPHGGEVQWSLAQPPEGEREREREVDEVIEVNLFKSDLRSLGLMR